MSLTGPVAALAAAPSDPQGLEEAWHDCLREAYAHQPAGQSRAGDARNALDECKEREDAYVAALMAQRPRPIWSGLGRRSRNRCRSRSVGLALGAIVSRLCFSEVARQAFSFREVIMIRPRCVGLPWYASEHYEALRASLADGAKLPPNYETGV